jgi:putative hydrolase of the HAD superfamily
MKKITTIFFDIGGVCLTNGWDETARQKSAKNFSLDYKEMERRHEPLSRLFEVGKLSLDEYLDEVVFHKERKFSKKEFVKFMFSLSHPFDSTTKILNELASKKKYDLATINNESRELNDFRINEFGLKKYFRCFFSSCYLGFRKPEEEIFDKALHIFHKDSGECLYIDDREENYKAAINSDINSILLDKPENLSSVLRKNNIDI